MTRRVIAALVLVASVTLAMTDLIRMYILAGHHLEALQLEIDKVPPFPGAERAGAMRTRKSRVAAVSEKYAGPAPRPQIFDYYRKVFETSGWQPCGHSITHDNYCRGEYEAIVSVPSAHGSGSYSVTLQWNRITWPVWLTACLLIYISYLSIAVLTTGHVPSRPRWKRSPLRLRSSLTAAEAMKQLEDTGGHDIVIRLGRPTDDGAVTFGLEKQRGRLTSSALAPYFHGTLRTDPATNGTIILGSFGFSPGAKAGGVFIVGIASFTVGLSLYRDESPEWVVLAIVVGIAGLILTRWTRRGDRREITAFLTNTLQAEPHPGGR